MCFSVLMAWTFSSSAEGRVRVFTPSGCNRELLSVTSPGTHLCSLLLTLACERSHPVDGSRLHGRRLTIHGTIAERSSTGCTVRNVLLDNTSRGADPRSAIDTVDTPAVSRETDPPRGENTRLRQTTQLRRFNHG